MLGVAGVLCALIVAGAIHTAAGDDLGGNGGDVRHLVAYGLAAALILARCATVPAGRRIWVAFGVGVTASLVGEALWIADHNEAGENTAAGLCFAAGYLAYGVGIALYLRRRVGYALRTLGFDAAGIGTYLLAIGAAVLLTPIVRHSGLSSTGAVFNLAPAAADAAIFSVILAIASFTGRRRGVQDVLLAGAFVVQCATDLAFALNLAGYADTLDRWHGTGWELGVALIAAAAWAPPASAGTLRVGGWWESAPTLSWTAAGGGVLVAAWRWQLPGPVVVLATATLTLAAVRSVRVLREVRTLVVIRAESLVDDLTGLPNQRAIFEELELVTREGGADGRRGALLIFNLAGFRELTDTMGHEAARAVLRPVADRLDRVVCGMLGRLSADEFVAFVEGAEPEAVAAAVRAALTAPVTVEGIAVTVGAVMGYARFPEDATTPAELARRAEVARQDAVERGLDIAAYDPERDGHSLERLGLVADLREALAGEGGLWLAFQPQLDLRTGAVHGLEALIRWRHPTRGELPPSEILPAAHVSGQMTALTDWVLERAIIQAAALNATGLALSVSVNVSPVTLVDVALPQRVAAALRRHGLPPAQLVLEVTEDAVMGDHQRCLQALAALTALGVGVSIDDFGTGQSSLAQLRHVPAHELKIDRSFVNGMATDPLDAEIVRLVLSLGRRLGLRVVAEGIETPEQRAILCELGCDVGQGFGLGRPMNAGALTAWLEREAAPPFEVRALIAPRGSSAGAQPPRPAQADQESEAGRAVFDRRSTQAAVRRR